MQLLPVSTSIRRPEIIRQTFGELTMSESYPSSVCIGGVNEDCMPVDGGVEGALDHKIKIPGRVKTLFTPLDPTTCIRQHLFHGMSSAEMTSVFLEAAIA